MNVSQPIASYIGSVDFRFLSSEDIKALSVKKIQIPTTFDTLLHPVPGGLYDASLGAWSDNPCATCHLNTYSCPGHVGHIELPVPVYHVTFMDQLLRLLRAKCAYCSHLRLPPTEVNRFICKLRLIVHGLAREVEELENIHLGSTAKKLRGEAAMDVDGESEESEEEDEETLKQRRNEFVRRAIKEKGGRNVRDTVASEKVESVSEVRRNIVKEFLATITKIKTCGTCKGVSPGFRKDRYSKIFRKPLNKKDKANMVQGGFKAVNPLVRAANERKAAQKQKREDREIDEGIVIDSDEITSDGEGEGRDIDMLDIEDEDAPTAVLEESAALRLSKIKVKDEPPDEYVNAQEIHASISELFHKEREIMELVYNHRATKNAKPISAEMFFIRDILVPPNKYRPEAKTGDGEIAEAQENQLYKNILAQCELLNQIRKEMSGSAPDTPYRRRDFRDLQNVWVRLQDAVNSMIDSDRNPLQGTAAKRNPDGIKQKLEKKEGLFRKNMMGKRVNFAARSVISPDPNIETNEIGVPPVFAKKLTYPEPVTNHNFYELKEAVLNGVEKWPGAAAIENENGQVINLRTKNFEERQALANQLLAPSNTTVTGARNKKVHRHLNNGDIVLMNRQPTLHKPSIMAHRARVLPGEKTIRMHYANCNTYNADFDGDEMNMHFPQNEIARAEALQIADTDHQYLAATAGKPLRGLIQDHISMGLWLTNRDTLFDREDYYQLLYGCLRPEDGQTASERIETVPSALVKPRVMWTGKQIITTVLKNITPVTHPGLTLLGRSQTSGDRWGEQSEEDIVMFQDSELLCGILDKAQLGPSGGGFIHSVYEAYGHTIAGKLLSVLGRLLTKLLNMRAFSCGVADLLLTERGEKNRLEQLKRADTIGLEVAAKYVTLENILDANDRELRSRLQDVLRDEEKQLGLDQVCNTQTAQLSSDITKACLPTGLQKPFPRNQMQAMTTSGAKGSSVNANLISCNLGQQVLEGRRVPVMVSGKTLPSFKPFETKVRAGGYITDRFLTGVKPQEYFFHAMAGREGLIDTAVKTSRSGYLQRCLIKGMEGLKSEYDNSVRDSDGSMVQFLYGEDGLDVTKQKHLTDFKFLAENYLSLVAQLNIKEEFSKLPDKGADEYQKAAMKLKKTGRIDALDPCLSVFDPGSSLGSTSESFASALKAYCDKNPENLLKDRKKAPKAPISKKTFTALVNIKYMKSVIEPGEAVGVVAGQSIGEPSTQMTLNTFHLAGHSAKNVTLGIPRLREIVMTASRQMSTPTMTLHLIPELDAAAGEKFAKGITKLTMAEVIDNVNVSESIGSGIGFAGAKIYKVRLDLFPAAEYCETYAITVADVLRTVEVKFIPILAKAIKKELTRKGDAKLLKVSASQPEVGKSSGIVEDAPARDEADLGGGEDDEDDNGDDDATNNKQKQNRAEAISYAEPDDEEEAMARDAQRRSSPELEEPEDEGFGGSLRAPQGDDNSQMNGDDEEDEEQKFRSSIAKEREFRIKEKTPSVTRFTFDDKSSQWCEIQLEYDITTAKMLLLPLVEKACHDAVIQSIPGLQACTVFKEKTHDPVTNEQIEVPVVLTQGVNLQAMHDYQDILNPHCIFTNDIAAMLTHYGVEACRATILREMDAVFKGHSISVDMRHLNLIADVMTRGGGFTPFNRNGLKSSVSPFMKMSFETTLGFLKDAVLEGDFDDLKNPSARIVMGKVGRVGTGAFDVLMPVDQ